MSEWLSLQLLMIALTSIYGKLNLFSFQQSVLESTSYSSWSDKRCLPPVFFPAALKSSLLKSSWWLWFLYTFEVLYHVLELLLFCHLGFTIWIRYFRRRWSLCMALLWSHCGHGLFLYSLTPVSFCRTDQWHPSNSSSLTEFLCLEMRQGYCDGWGHFSLSFFFFFALGVIGEVSLLLLSPEVNGSGLGVVLVAESRSMVSWCWQGKLAWSDIVMPSFK